MASSVFFRFKSQKEPQRIKFDGTGISVFEVKRDIITISKLGDGTEFDLSLINPDTKEEYDDDTTIIPRSTTVIARRTPASRPGQGRAARYLTGKAPTTAKGVHRMESSNTPVPVNERKKMDTTPNKISRAPETEEEKIRAREQESNKLWEQQKQQMAGATPVPFSGGRQGIKRPPAEPRAPLNPNYICYRCFVKGHHITECPTNNDPDFGPRNKRYQKASGIPTSQLVEIDPNDEDESRGKIMVNTQGKRVRHIPDNAAWEEYQAKTEAAKAKELEIAAQNNVLRERGLACLLEDHLLVNPVKTPCCDKIYCRSCIESALEDSGLQCPACSTQITFDGLTPDDDAIAKVKEYEKEQRQTETEKTKARSPEKSPHLTAINMTKSPSSSNSNSKKRPADEELANESKRSTSNSRQMTPSQAPAQPVAPENNVNEQLQQFLPPDPSQVNLAAMSGMPMGNMMNGMNPAILAGFNPLMMGGMHPAMMQGMNMNPAMMGGGNGMYPGNMAFSQQQGGAQWPGPMYNGATMPNDMVNGYGGNGYAGGFGQVGQYGGSSHGQFQNRGGRGGRRGRW